MSSIMCPVFSTTTMFQRIEIVITIWGIELMNGFVTEDYERNNSKGIELMRMVDCWVDINSKKCEARQKEKKAFDRSRARCVGPTDRDACS